MATPFKSEINPASIRQAAEAIAAIAPDFPVEPFVAAATAGLDGLELKARIEHVADRLAEYLPGPFAQAAGTLAEAADRADLNGWQAWPFITFVERHGLAAPAAALTAIARITRHASAEFAIRPYLERYPDLVFPQLAAWAASDDPHLRRLVSEGTRPLLPWAPRLPGLQRDPSPVLPLLDRLRDDPEPSVRKSVANHLNDIAKSHPDLACRIAERWLAEGGVHVQWVVSHGLRTLVKQGEPAALALIGAAPSAAVDVLDLQVRTPVVRLGEALRFAFTVRSQAAGPVRVVLDYVIHHRKANGQTAPKVFKLTTRTLAPGELAQVERSHRVREITTRRYYAGEHRLEIQVNGRVLAAATFELAL